jgi:PPK2 family polyphosphate:nucleotide phosphotransferase
MSSKADFVVPPGKPFRLADHDPAHTGKADKQQGIARLEKARERMRELQEKLFAQNEWALLVIFQAMDGAGKDSTIEHVMSGLNPAGCQVFSFKAPSDEELDHDFLWRTSRCLPERGRIGVFNRSYYEEVVVVRVHPEFLDGQKLPEKVVTDRIWEERFEDINAFERYVTRQGVAVLKFFLNVSREEQRERFLARLEEPEKNWKFSAEDVLKRSLWEKYAAAYEEMLAKTSTAHAPWHVIPADKKWFMRAAVAEAIVGALEGLDLRFPAMDEKQQRKLEEARALLTGEEKKGKKEKEKGR